MRKCNALGSLRSSRLWPCGRCYENFKQIHQHLAGQARSARLSSDLQAAGRHVFGRRFLLSCQAFLKRCERLG